MEKQSPHSKRHQEQQGPASLQVEGPSAGYTLEELGQPTRSDNAHETMPKEKWQTK